MLKKMIKCLVVIIILTVAFSTVAFAEPDEDHRIQINNITATTTRSKINNQVVSIPTDVLKYGDDAKVNNFPYIKVTGGGAVQKDPQGELYEAEVLEGISNIVWFERGSWSKKVNDEFVDPYYLLIPKFTAGVWRYTAYLWIGCNNFENYDNIQYPNAGVAYTFSNNVNVKINGEDWTVEGFMEGEADSTCCIVHKDFTISEPTDLYFFDTDEYDIYNKEANIPIAEIDVSRTAEGGTKPYTFSKAQGPSWVSVSSSGIVSGTPTKNAAHEKLTIKCTDSASRVKSITISLGETNGGEDGREVISNVSLTSTNIKSIVKPSNKLTTMPNMNVVIGTPAHVDLSGASSISSCWQVFANDDWYNIYNSVNFESGVKYRFAAKVVVDGSGGEQYKLDEDNLTVSLNGKSMELGEFLVGDFFSSVFAYSEPFIAGENGGRSIISTITATSTNIVDIPKITNSVSTIPTITMTKGSPAYFDLSEEETYWIKQNGINWYKAETGEFLNGYKYRLHTMIYIDEDSPDNPNAGNEFLLADKSDLTVTLNGVPMEVINVVVDESECFAIVYSPIFEVGGREVISQIVATSDIESIPKTENEVYIKPEFTVINGEPAEFWNGDACWLVWDGDSWQRVTSGNFGEGRRYKFETAIYVDGDNGELYVLDGNYLTVTLDGEPMEIVRLEIFEDRSYVVVCSKEFTVDSRTFISTITATSTDLESIPRTSNPVTRLPQITVTTGYPAYFYTDAGQGYWQKLDGATWKRAMEGNFEAGETYRFVSMICIDGDISGGSPSENAADEYVMDANVTIFLNGEEMELDELSIEGVSVAVAHSKSFVVTSASNVMKGDLNGDGEITIMDIRLLLQAFINCTDQSAWTSSQLAVMDMNGDNLVDIIDIRLLLQVFINQ